MGFDKNSGPRQPTPSTWFNEAARPVDLKRTRSPHSTFKDVVQNSTTHQINKSPHSQQNHFFPIPPKTQRPSVSPPRLTSNVWTPPYADLDKHETDPTELPVPKRTRPPFSTDLVFRGNPSVHDDAKRPSVSPPRLSRRPSDRVWTPPYADLDKPETDPTELPVPKRTRSPFSTDIGFRGNTSVHDDAKRFSVSPPRLSTRLGSRIWNPPYADLDKPETNPSEFPVPKRNRPPFSNDFGLQANGSVNDVDTERPSVSPPRLSTRPSNHVWTPPFADLDKPATNPSELPGPKRTRSPLSADPGLRGHNAVHDDDDAERELQAKAKRLARFRDELNQPEPSEVVNRNQKPQQADVLGMDKRKFMAEVSDTTTGYLRNTNSQIDGEDQISSTVIIGYCPDMCPEQERGERERKGDLDQYERLDGDRNHTTEYLAVKKYTRTAEREAALIRPMEILQKTMDYLLNLLDQPYDDRFLGLYNFLWDRMRAIRMDLRMQHIFNLGAITMLEQMIRLHIIAMHELCEYTKGEGFSEGFDAHLNIEQMNKTSVELFQLYDDHRKNGIEVPTEREFRGYYALLKLDKHPGYKVEPSELSLDLAKMTTGIRQAEQVLFARNVARACRTGNFIAFFRLVRKASYLQACLMHAHFGKLRTQALAALHSGLQNNQGIPVTQVAKWLGMEEENMEDLLEYHGFSIKEFEEPYMVKEGQLLNGDTEYPLKCSKLVHLKRSTTIAGDVLSPPTRLMESLPPKALPVDNTQLESPAFHKETTPFFAAVDSQTPIFSKAIDSHMANNMQESSVNTNTRPQPMFSIPVVVDSLELASSSPRDIFKTNSSFKSPKSASTSFTKPSFDKLFESSLEKHSQSNVFAKNVFLEETLPDVQPVEQDPIIQQVEELEPENTIQQLANENENEIDTTVDEEVAEAKLKLILRLWRRRASIKKDLRDKKQLAATAALSSLSLGPPVRHCKEQLEVAGDFDLDRVMHERYEKQKQLRSRLNVSNVVASTLGKRNKYPNCICWKLLFSSLDTASWLLYKLMPENISNNDEEIVASLPGVTIWKSSSDLTCYLSVVRNIQADDDLVEETVLGASAVMFLASESFSWESQKIRLHNIISLIPHASRLPLLILSGCSRSTVFENLGLNRVDKSKICSFSVLSINSEESFKKALDWLASESPVQPVVHCVKTRELVMNRLQFDPHKTSPKECISAINNAVDESVKDICDAINSNPASWPCPEVLLLDFQILESYLPSVGWSSASRIEPLIQALNNCKLPNNKSWCSLTGDDIQNQKVQLEHLLVTYLSPLIGSHMAQRETSTMIQTCVGLELHDSTYYLVPKWTVIFRRIFNWQLAGLSQANAYVLDRHHNSVPSFEDELCNLKSPSLDEMMQVMIRPRLEPDYKDLEGEVCEAPVEVEVEVVVDSVNYVEEERKVNERSLSRLLEQCNIVQDMIDKKLSIYF